MLAIGEIVRGYERSTWMMIFSPADSPAAFPGFRAGVADSRLGERIEESGNDPMSAAPKEAETLWRQEQEKLTALMSRAGLAQG